MFSSKTAACIAIALSAAFTLASCSSTPQPTVSVPSTKEAGMLGSRVCFTNSTSLPMTVSPSQRVVSENVNHIVGAAGAINKSSEQCFAGWNSYQTVVYMKDDAGQAQWLDISEDVSVSVGIDGHYNVLNFRANNLAFVPPYLYWTNDPNRPTSWGGEELSVGSSYQDTSGGHSFTVTRRDDSEFYKEFTVNFTK